MPLQNPPPPPNDRDVINRRLLNVMITITGESYISQRDQQTQKVSVISDYINWLKIKYNFAWEILIKIVNTNNWLCYLTVIDLCCLSFVCLLQIKSIEARWRVKCKNFATLLTHNFFSNFKLMMYFKVAFCFCKVMLDVGKTALDG